MTFTAYSSALTADRDKVRFYIGDTVSGSGPKPADGDYSDEEIAALITIEGSWQQAVAAVFENLAALWAKHVTFTAGTSISANQSDIAKSYRQAALDWRGRYGYGVTSAGMASMTRADGYSDNIDNVTLDD